MCRYIYILVCIYVHIYVRVCAYICVLGLYTIYALSNWSRSVDDLAHETRCLSGLLGWG